VLNREPGRARRSDRRYGLRKENIHPTAFGFPGEELQKISVKVRGRATRLNPRAIGIDRGENQPESGLTVLCWSWYRQFII